MTQRLKSGKLHANETANESERIIPNTQPTDTDGYQRIPADTAHTDYDYDYDYDMDTDKECDFDMDTDTDTDLDRDNDIDTDLEQTINTISDGGIRYTFEQIDLIAHAIDEESNNQYPYESRLVRRFYEMNRDRGWCGTDGNPITDIVRWYKQYLDHELTNGYSLKDIAEK